MTTVRESVKGGFTWRVLLIIVFVAFIFTPITIWMGLSLGGGVLPTFAILLLVTELARILGSPFSAQEVATLVVGMGALNFGYGVTYIQTAYFSQSPILESYGLTGMIPYWVAPPPETGFFASRSLWHPWTRGIWLRIDNLLLPGITAIAGLALGILNKILYVDEEKLPYPQVQVTAEFCSTITVREKFKYFIFSASFFVAFLYGVFMYVIPQIIPVMLVPILWFDMSPFLQTFMPGAIFGIATTLPTLTLGLYLPGFVIISQLIGSVAIWVFGNWYVVTNRLTEFSNIYFTGMRIEDIYIWAYQYVWMMPTVGLGVFIGFSVLRPSLITRTFSTLRKAGKAEELGERVFSVWLVVIPVASIIVINLLDIWYWAPDYPFFPWLPAAFSLFLSFAQSLLIGRAGGTGISVSIPGYLDKLALMATNYKGVNAWYVSPVIISPSFGGYVDQNFKLAQLTQSSFTDFLKFFFIVTPISVVFSMIFTQVFWGLYPIPSSAYPMSMISWPRDVIHRAVWITRPRGIFRLDWIIYSALVGLALYLILSVARLPAAAILTSLLAGMTTLPPIATSMLIGYIVRLSFERLVGKERYNRYSYTIVAGLIAGTGFAVLIAVSGLLILMGLRSPPVPPPSSE